MGQGHKVNKTSLKGNPKRNTNSKQKSCIEKHTDKPRRRPSFNPGGYVSFKGVWGYEWDVFIPKTYYFLQKHRQAARKQGGRSEETMIHIAMID